MATGTPEIENVDGARNASPKQNIAAEKMVFGTRTDRRQRILPLVDDQAGTVDALAPCDYHSRGYPCVGLLRMQFSDQQFTGTATMIADGSCLLTCAQNVVEYDKPDLTEEPIYATPVWFELRKNEAAIGSTLIKRYKIIKTEVHPKYFEDPTSNSGFDLALCWIDVPENDHTIAELHKTTDIPIPTVRVSDLTGKIAVVGFPGECEGEKWGMAVEIPSDKRKDWIFSLKDRPKKILTYDFIDTSPGQSGSPIMHLGQESCEIIGVHTGASQVYKKKWGTFITPTKLDWIVQCLGRPWVLAGDSNHYYLSMTKY